MGARESAEMKKAIQLYQKLKNIPAAARKAGVSATGLRIVLKRLFAKLRWNDGLAGTEDK